MPCPKEPLPFLPARVLLQDFTGIPVVADLAALRAEMARKGGDPQRVNPDLMVDLVIDHSVQVDAFGIPDAFRINVDREYERNRERYAFLRWAQKSFRNFRVVPPGAGIVHQVNLEFLAPVVQTQKGDGKTIAFPDTLVGTDSHTTMINGLGVLGWGVGGIEAEAAMLNQPLPLLAPEVIGVPSHRRAPRGRHGDRPRAHGHRDAAQVRRRRPSSSSSSAPGLSNLSLPDRATIANMSPEYGATCGYFPVDAETLRYLQLTGRDPAPDRPRRALLPRAGPLPRGQDAGPVVHGVSWSWTWRPSRPAWRGRDVRRTAYRWAPCRTACAEAFQEQFRTYQTSKERFDWEGGTASEKAPDGGVSRGDRPAIPRKSPSPSTHDRETLRHGSVVIAAITSCTNTSNPSVMLAAGLVAQEGRRARPRASRRSSRRASRRVRAPSSTTWSRAGLLDDLEKLHFNLVGFGCTTCIGNSGPLDEPVAQAVDDNDLVVAAVLSGNRNFEGRIHPQVRAAYLASPPLVVAYALAGTVDTDLRTEPLGHGQAR